MNLTKLEFISDSCFLVQDLNDQEVSFKKASGVSKLSVAQKWEE